MQKLARGKTPGLDGLPVEIYQCFWTEIKDIFFKAICDSYQRGKMNDSAMEGVLNLIPKPKKDSRYLKNLRPITLLNVDYKIVEKAIALRIQDTLHLLIDEDQTGFMKKRRAAVSVRKLIDLMDFCKKENLDAMHLSLDYMKAFDRPEMRSIIGALNYFNFPECITRWISILYTNFGVKIQNHGKFTATIPVERSVHQGGCASAFLYILLAETLAHQIRSDSRIQEICVGNSAHKLNMFADDTNATTKTSQQNLDALIENFDNFHLHQDC